MAEPKRVSVADWERANRQNYYERALQQHAMDPQSETLDPTQIGRQLFAQYGNDEFGFGAAPWRNPDGFAGWQNFITPEMISRFEQLAPGEKWDLNRKLADAREHAGGGYYTPDAQGFMYVPDMNESGGLLKQALELAKPIGMTAGVGLGIGAGLGALTGGAVGLGSGAATAGSASAGSSAASGGSLGSGITAGTTTGGIGAGQLGTGLIPGTASTSIGGGALGSGIGAGAGSAATGAGLAGAGALAPGFFSSESAYPVVGGETSAAVGGGGDALAPAGTGTGEGLTLGTIAARGLPGLLGAIAANEQASAYSDAADQYMSYGAPSRQRFEASFGPGFSMENDPGYKDAMDQAAKAAMRALSVNGNPAGSPNAWGAALQDLYQKNAYNALQEYRRMNAGAGGMAALTSAAPSMTGNAIQAQGGVYGGLGAAAADIFNPPKSLAQVLKELKVTL